MAATVKLEETQERDVTAVECPACGGFAPGTDDETAEEIKQYQDCGWSWACCIAAFVCKKCGQRIIAKLESPEME